MNFSICTLSDIQVVVPRHSQWEDAGKCQYGAYDTTFVQHRRLADALLVQALAFFMHEDPIWKNYK